MQPRLHGMLPIADGKIAELERSAVGWPNNLKKCAAVCNSLNVVNKVTLVGDAADFAAFKACEATFVVSHNFVLPCHDTSCLLLHHMCLPCTTTAERHIKSENSCQVLRHGGGSLRCKRTLQTIAPCMSHVHDGALQSACMCLSACCNDPICMAAVK